MAKQIQNRRGTTVQHSTFTGAEGEITVDTTKDTAVVHDGTTAGGHPLAKSAELTAHLNDTVAAHDASAISNVPAGAIAATTVQAAINELDTEKQPKDATLTAIAAVTTAADKVIYATGVDTFSTTTVTAAARTLLDDVDVAAMRTTLGVSATNTPSTAVGGIVATNVQAAIQELDSEKLNVSAYNAADILTKVKTVDGNGSGLDADLLGGTGSATYLAAVDAIDWHLLDNNNPHSVNKAQIGLGNVDNTSDINKPISTLTQNALGTKVDKSVVVTSAITSVTFNVDGSLTIVTP